jgi:hypothetical protein
VDAIASDETEEIVTCDDAVASDETEEIVTADDAIANEETEEIVTDDDAIASEETELTVTDDDAIASEETEEIFTADNAIASDESTICNTRRLIQDEERDDANVVTCTFRDSTQDLTSRQRAPDPMTPPRRIDPRERATELAPKRALELARKRARKRTKYPSPPCRQGAENVVWSFQWFSGLWTAWTAK